MVSVVVVVVVDVDNDGSVLLLLLLMLLLGGMLMSPLQRVEVQVQAYDEESTGWGLQVSAGNIGAVMSPSRTEPGRKHSLTTKLSAHL